MNWNQTLFSEMAALALRAPSVHNVQPWKVHFTPDGFELFQVKSRRLFVGDPKLHDNDVSLGCFIELASIFLKERGLDITLTEEKTKIIKDQDDEYEQRFKVNVSSGPIIKDSLAPFISKRRSYRGIFQYDPNFNENTLKEIQIPGLEIKWITGPSEMKKWAALYDESSSQINKNPGYFQELIHWLRFSENHAKFNEDGLNYKALSLGKAEALMGSLLFKVPVFKLLSLFSLEKILITEAPQIKSAQGIIIIYAQKSLNSLEMGRAFVRLWLSLAAREISVCPLSSLVDFTGTFNILNSLKSSDATIPLNVLRFGKVANEKDIYSSPRLSVERIILK